MKALLFVGLIIAEVLLTRSLATLIGWGALLVWFVLAFALGTGLMRRAGRVLVPQLQGGKLQGDPGKEVVVSITQAFAGLLLIVPGVLSDIIAGLLLLPPVQAQLQERMSAAIRNRGGGFVWTGAFGVGPGSDIIDGQARTVDSETVTPPSIPSAEQKEKL